MEISKQINKNKLPQHIAIIMDGNGRWAKRQGHERLFGHAYGVESVREVVSACGKLGVRYLTLYAFSTENWNRPKDEVNGLMELMVKTIMNELPELKEKGIRIRCIGDIEALPDTTKKELKHAMIGTADNSKLDLILALNYSARWEITRAMQYIAEQIKSNRISIKDIDEQLISLNLSTVGIPDPELLIRTSGELRLSNFLLWQSSYSELYFTEVLWPDFNEEELYKAVLNYQDRERRFGQTSEQLTSEE